MIRIQNTVKSIKGELKQLETRNSNDEKKLIQKKNLEAKLLEDILNEYDATQEVKAEEHAKLKKERELIREKIKLLEDNFRELRLEKECFLQEDIEWKRKTKIMKLETEEQVHAVGFLVNFWRIQNMKKRRKKKRRRRKKKTAK